MTDTVRRFRMTRLGKGDYLLPSNDGVSFFRIATYDEDGSAHNGERFLSGRFWGVWKYVGRSAVIDPMEWNDFEMRECLIGSRRDAIEIALSGGAS